MVTDLDTKWSDSFSRFLVGTVSVVDRVESKGSTLICYLCSEPYELSSLSYGRITDTEKSPVTVINKHGESVRIMIHQSRNGWICSGCRRSRLIKFESTQAPIKDTKFYPSREISTPRERGHHTNLKGVSGLKYERDYSIIPELPTVKVDLDLEDMEERRS